MRHQRQPTRDTMQLGANRTNRRDRLLQLRAAQTARDKSPYLYATGRLLCFDFEVFEKSVLFDQKSSKVLPSTTPMVEFCTSASEWLIQRATQMRKSWVCSHAAPSGFRGSKVDKRGASVHPPSMADSARKVSVELVTLQPDSSRRVSELQGGKLRSIHTCTKAAFEQPKQVVWGAVRFEQVGKEEEEEEM